MGQLVDAGLIDLVMAISGVGLAAVGIYTAWSPLSPRTAG